ncbi:hypothetical protein BP5796_03242 [Coleophoma crateriformis]|uniref:DUF3752 domain-containing protein n=1 Tax=Coleophoma crateriformis TaxID=565419 RepID=A0A3D8SP29_9HELO|nr:hypothetical protein BP5796_03242 [Coleophoma crateriformis]
MSSVGPQLPAHLAKRKRSIDDEEAPGSPPRKLQAAEEPCKVAGPAAPTNNEGEIALSSDDDSDFGPSAGPAAPISNPPVGPSAPPASTEGEIALSDDDDEDDYGPAAPSGDLKAPSGPAPTKRVLGPAPPPASLSERPSSPADSSSDDDDYGPSLPPAPGSAAERQMLVQRSEDNTRIENSNNTPARPQRDDWMLVPPSDSDWSSRVDPTKLKNRKFASGKGAKAPAEKSGISGIWTETPEQKRQRLEDEVLGRKDASTSSHKAGPSVMESREDEATSRRIREYNERNRNRSLYEEHKKAVPKEKEDDPSARGFDKEKDMALGGRIGHVQKRDMIGKAADFGSRFQKGRYL